MKVYMGGQRVTRQHISAIHIAARRSNKGRPNEVWKAVNPADAMTHPRLAAEGVIGLGYALYMANEKKGKNSRQPTIIPTPAPQAKEDPISCVERLVGLAWKHPKETKAVVAGLAIATLLYILWDSKNN